MNENMNVCTVSFKYIPPYNTPIKGSLDFPSHIDNVTYQEIIF